MNTQRTGTEEAGIARCEAGDGGAAPVTPLHGSASSSRRSGALPDAGDTQPLTEGEAACDAMAERPDRPAARDLVIRRLGHVDLPEIERHLLALSQTERRARFGTALGDAAIVAYARQIDPTRGILMGVVDELSGRILGLAEAQPADAPGWVEVAVSVQAPHRQRGLGRYLVGAVLAAAFERGAEAAEFLFAPGNRPIAGLVRALGARINATLDRAEIRCPLPTRRQAA